MGRVALGAAAKDKVAGVRLTKSQEAALKAKYGTTTASAALRIIVDRELQEELAK